MRGLLFILSLLFVASAQSVADDEDRTITSGPIQVQFVGASGKIKLSPSLNASHFLMLGWSQLRQVDDEGRTVPRRHLNLVTGHARWTAPSIVEFQSGQIQTTTTYSTTHTVDGAEVNVGISASVFSKPDMRVNGNDTVEIYAHSVKFDLLISGWPAPFTSGGLEFELHLTHSGGSSGGKMRSKNATKSARTKQVQVSSGVAEMPTWATIDDTPNSPINVTLTSRGNRDVILFLFPPFSSSVQYDPVLALNSPESYSEPSTSNPAAPTSPASTTIINTDTAEVLATHERQDLIWGAFACIVILVLLGVLAYHLHRRANTLSLPIPLQKSSTALPPRFRGASRV